MSGDIKRQIEDLSQAIVLVELGDREALKDLIQRFESVREWADGAGESGIIAAVTAVQALIQTAMDEETPGAGARIELASRTVSSLQEIILHGRGVDEVDFPTELGIEPSTAPEERASEAPADPPAYEPEESAGESESDFVPATGGPVPPVSLPSYVDEKIFSDFLGDQKSTLEEMEKLILSLEKEEGEAGLKQFKGILHTLKGESGLLGLTDVQKLCHAVEDALDQADPKELVEELLSVKDWLFQTFRHYSGEGDQPDSVDALLQALAGAGKTQGEEAAKPPEPGKDSSSSTEATGEKGMSFAEDPELLGDFITESNEHLEAADVHLLTLETEPSEEEALNAVFRAFHTIKGVAGFLELEQIQQLAHESENVLDQARKGELVMAGAVIDLIFDSVDVLKRLIEDVRHSLTSGAGLTHEPAVDSLIERLGAALTGKLTTDAYETDAERPERDGKLGDILVETGAATPEDVAEALEKQDTPPEPKRVGQLLVESAVTSSVQIEKALAKQAQSDGEARIGEVLVEAGKVSQKDLESALKRQNRPPEKPKLGEVLVREGKAPAKQVAKALREQKAAKSARGGGPQQGVEVKETIKVDADRLDILVDTIGELVIAESMVVQKVTDDDGDREALGRLINHLDKITRELQEMGMSLRMVPVRSTFQRMARLARDVAKKTGKRIDFVSVGDDTELDKTVVDRISDPLVHMIRNSVDHGIETDPAERVKAGKPAEGRVELRAFHKGSNIYIEIEDDGRGLDREVILAKAIERGLVKEEDNLSDKEVYNLIFEPGLSTAKVVTDVSGRGVGLDVVRRSIEALRGKVEIESTLGKGTIFSIRLPLTLAIIDGMVVRVGAERYIIPTLSVVRSIRPKSHEISTVFERGDLISIQGETMPLFKLGTLFEAQGAQSDPTRAIVVLIEDEGRHAGLLVDDLLGQQQIVIKSLGGAMQGMMGVAGGAIMRDGSVGLIIDVSGLIELAHGDEASADTSANESIYGGDPSIPNREEAKQNV